MTKRELYCGCKHLWMWSDNTYLLVRIYFESPSFPLGHETRRNKQEAWRSWKERERGTVLSKKRIIHRKKSKTSRIEIITEKSWYGWTGNEIMTVYQNLQWWHSGTGKLVGTAKWNRLDHQESKTFLGSMVKTKHLGPTSLAFLQLVPDKDQVVCHI